MRGEETQVAGFLALNEGWDGTLCLPGSHTKWVAVSAGEVTGFRTFMTGELFAAATGHTVLRHSVGDGAGTTTPSRRASRRAWPRPRRSPTASSRSAPRGCCAASPPARRGRGPRAS